jgi:hypothetical protein
MGVEVEPLKETLSSMVKPLSAALYHASGNFTKFYEVVLIVELTTVAVFLALKNLHSALSVCVCVLVFLSEQLCANSQGAPVNSVPSMRVKLEDMIWLSGTRAANGRNVTIH